MEDARQQFKRALSGKRRWHQACMLSCALVWWGRLALLGLLVIAVLDFFLTLSAGGRTALLLLGCAALAFQMLWDLINVFGFTRREMAEQADRALQLARQPVLTAWELHRSPAAEAGSLHQFLLGKSLQAGAEALGRLSLKDIFPQTVFKRQTLLALLVVVLAVGLFSLHPEAARITWLRVTSPRADIPPYSPYQFIVSPGRAQVLYGGEIEVRVEVKGGPVNQPVRLLTRKGNQMAESVCFRDGDAAYSQKLEKVVDPLEFSFAMGKARSEWFPLSVVLQPKISMARLEIQPPAYTGLAKKESLLGQGIIEGYRGSRAQLHLTSNRPLAKGKLIVTPASGIEQTKVIEGKSSGPHTLSFDWEIQQAAQLNIQVEDVLGTQLAEPLKSQQRLTADRAPEVAIHSPAPYALATPSSHIPLQATASDDLALRSVELVRTITGFRDRLTPLGPPAPEKRFTVQNELNLQQLGVVAGQIIELYLEARDFNPDRTGIGTSDIIRLEIIPDEEYAEMIRANETVEQLVDRYLLVQKKMGEFRETIEELQKELAKPQPDRARLEKLLDAARLKNQETRAVAKKMAEEFKAYDIENQWSELLKNIDQRMEGQGNLLWGMKPESPQLAQALERLKQEFAKDEERVQQQVAQAEEIAKVGRVMEQAARFMSLLNKQRQLVRQLQRFDAVDPPPAEDLPRYRRQQQEMREELQALEKEMREAAAGLPNHDDYEKLKQSTQEFAQALAESGAGGLMEQAVSAADNQDGPQSHRQARLALEKLEALLKKKQEEGSQFAGMCQNKIGSNMREELKQTLSQMLNSMLNRSSGSGSRPEGAGEGPGGEGKDGYSVPAQTRMNTPMFGPPRSTSRRGGAKGGSGQGGVGDAPVVPEDSRHTAGVPASRIISGGARSPELAPEKYRDALKRYFQQAEEKP
jgi:hypothetical protein